MTSWSQLLEFDNSREIGTVECEDFCLRRAGQAVIPKSDIRTITTPSKNGLGSGAGIGTVIGAGLGLGAFGLGAHT